MEKVIKFIKINDISSSKILFSLFSSTTVFDLHAFLDASKRAYTTVTYLSNGESSISVLSKTKVAPIQPVSLPLLELL